MNIQLDCSKRVAIDRQIEEKVNQIFQINLMKLKIKEF